MSATVTFDVVRFRQDFLEFSNETQYPTDTLQNYFNNGTCIIGNVESLCLNGECLIQALNLITAHICQIADNNRTGKLTGVVNSSSIGRVSVSLSPPPFGTSQWNWWLNTTTYGQWLSAMMDGLAAGGQYFGGSCERQGFRKIGGTF